MKEQKIRFTPIPSTAEVEAERERLAYRSRYMRVLRSTVYTLLVVAAVAVLLATLFLPVLQVSGDSMNPTLQDRDIILLVKDSDMKTGDLCGFYWQNKLLLKRIIGLPGDVIELDEDGVVTVNGQTLYCAAAGTGAYHQPVRELAAARRGHCQNGRISVRRVGARAHCCLL